MASFWTEGNSGECVEIVTSEGRFQDIFYVRTPHDPVNIITELRTIADPSIAQFVSVLLSMGDNSDQSQATLASAYNSAEVADLRIYAIGDGEAIPELIIAGSRNTGETTVLVALLD